MDVDDLKPGDLFTESQLHDTFIVKSRGGIRKSLKTKRILLISSAFTVKHGQGNYKDTVDLKNKILYYTGEGNDDQQMTRNNKGILNSHNDGFRLLYFEKPYPNHLIFKFEVKYDSHCNKTQVNSEGQPREVIVFKLNIL